MVKDISYLWLCMFILGGSSLASHIPVVQYLPYGSTANFFVRSLTDSLRERHSNSDLRGIIKIGQRSRLLFGGGKVNMNGL